MKKFKQIIIIIIGLLLLCFLSARNKNKAGTCCPFKIKNNGGQNE